MFDPTPVDVSLWRGRCEALQAMRAEWARLEPSARADATAAFCETSARIERRTRLGFAEVRIRLANPDPAGLH